MPIPKAKDLGRLIDLAKAMREQAGRVVNNCTYRRVSHTLASMKKLVQHVTTLRKGLEDDKGFVKEFEFALYQCQRGPTEIRHDAEGRVFIQGSFDVDQLREFFVVNEPLGMITITVEGPKS